MASDKLARGGGGRLLTRILEQPRLVGAVQSLAPRALYRLIDRVGLEDAGEIVALATTAQLERVFDEDVWRSERAGEDERFDPRRFALWLEVMREAGDAFAADKLAELPEDLVALGLHAHVLVIDLDALALAMSERGDDDDAAQLEKALESGLYCEFGQYRVIARRHDGWEAISNLLLAMDERHADALARLLERLCQASSEYIDDNGGLYQVLTSEEMLESDAAAEREDRRSRAGYVAPSSAAAFLALARQKTAGEVLAEAARDPMTQAYFRAYQAAAVAEAAATGEASRRAEELLDLVGEEAGEEVAAPRPRGLLAGAEASPRTLLQRALVELQVRDADAHAERVRELGYLANVLVAGASRGGERFRALEAAEAALAVANLGFERAQAAGARLERTGCDKLFRIGWRILADEVARPAAEAVARVAERIGARSLAQAARAAVENGRFAALRARLDPLADALPPERLAELRALLDECPALLSDGRRAPIAAREQVERARALVARLDR